MFFRLPKTVVIAHSDFMHEDQLKEKSIEILKPIFPDYTEEQLIEAGTRIADFLQHTYVLFKDELPSNKRRSGLEI